MYLIVAPGPTLASSLALAEEPKRSLLRRLWQPAPGSPSRLSTAGSFRARPGSRISRHSVEGYYVDFRFKAQTPSWPPAHIPIQGMGPYVAVAQWGLGAYERFLAGEGEAWLHAARRAANTLVSEQQLGGDCDGGWLHKKTLGHTFPLTAPWMSAMAQGEGASLLVRVADHFEDDYAERALRALEPLRRPTAEGGVHARLDGGIFFEEYPTDPPSFVLNGGIFALWGCHDVALALSSPVARQLADEGKETLAANIHRYDTGQWSTYDLFPHPVPNIASPAYHRLHIDQLRAHCEIAPDPRITRVIDRFEDYAASRACSANAMARKVAFRLVVPRNKRLAALLMRRRRAAT